MKFKLSVLIGIFVLIMSLAGCSTAGKNKSSILPEPDKIIIYNNGTEIKKLDKNSTEFNKLFELTNSRFNNKLSTATDIIDEHAMSMIKEDGLGLEFVYSSEQNMNIKGDGFTPFKYYRLYFQITSKTYGNNMGSTVHSFQHGDKDQYLEYSRGPLKYSEELVKEVQKLTK